MRTVKTLCLGLATAGSLFVGVATAADITSFEEFQKYLTDNKIVPPCTTCHKVDAKLVGPSYNAVALYYKDKPDAAAMLEKKILAGGGGVWGVVPMTPNVTAKDHVGTLVKWVLSLNPEGDAKAKAEAEIAAMPKKEEKK